ncbi:hypothetical protein, partial [Enterobacter hormaechei]
PFTRQRKRQNQPGRGFFVRPAGFVFLSDAHLLLCFFFRVGWGDPENGVEDHRLGLKSVGDRQYTITRIQLHHPRRLVETIAGTIQNPQKPEHFGPDSDF